jgi:hypothetical protein
MANKFILIPQEIYRGLTTSETGNINLDTLHRDLEKTRRTRKNASAKNINYNQELRRYLHLRNEMENKPLNVAVTNLDESSGALLNERPISYPSITTAPSSISSLPSTRPPSPPPPTQPEVDQEAPRNRTRNRKITKKFPARNPRRIKKNVKKRIQPESEDDMFSASEELETSKRTVAGSIPSVRSRSPLDNEPSTSQRRPLSILFRPQKWITYEPALTITRPQRRDRIIRQEPRIVPSVVMPPSPPPFGDRNFSKLTRRKKTAKRRLATSRKIIPPSESRRAHLSEIYDDEIITPGSRSLKTRKRGKLLVSKIPKKKHRQNEMALPSIAKLDPLPAPAEIPAIEAPPTNAIQAPRRMLAIEAPPPISAPNMLAIEDPTPNALPAPRKRLAIEAAPSNALPGPSRMLALEAPPTNTLPAPSQRLAIEAPPRRFSKWATRRLQKSELLPEYQQMLEELEAQVPRKGVKRNRQPIPVEYFEPKKIKRRGVKRTAQLEPKRIKRAKK